MQPLLLIIASLVILGSGLFAAQDKTQGTTEGNTQNNSQGGSSTLETDIIVDEPIEVPDVIATTSQATTSEPVPSGAATTSQVIPEPEDTSNVTVGDSTSQSRLVQWEETVATFINEEILRAKPLPSGNSKGALSAGAILAETNSHRGSARLNVLVTDATLEKIASAKVDDMFAKNYFAHVSPTGVDIGSLAGQFSYSYLLIGENLAEGNFKDAEHLVDAWMNSPGHRANIVHPRYTHIGIALKEGVIGGKKNWLAVQVFGLPRSVCSYPSTTMKSQIASGKAQLETLQATIVTDRATLEALSPSSSNYNQRIEAFNTRVAAYNNLLSQQKTSITQYNAQVDAYNRCVGQYTN